MMNFNDNLVCNKLFLYLTTMHYRILLTNYNTRILKRHKYGNETTFFQLFVTYLSLLLLKLRFLKQRFVFVFYVNTSQELQQLIKCPEHSIAYWGRYVVRLKKVGENKETWKRKIGK